MTRPGPRAPASWACSHVLTSRRLRLDHRRSTIDHRPSPEFHVQAKRSETGKAGQAAAAVVKSWEIMNHRGSSSRRSAAPQTTVHSPVSGFQPHTVGQPANDTHPLKAISFVFTGAVACAVSDGLRRRQICRRQQRPVLEDISICSLDVEYPTRPPTWLQNSRVLADR